MTRRLAVALIFTFLFLVVSGPCQAAVRAAWVGDGVNKGGGVFDPRGYGAEGDGVADDEPAITLAAAAAAGNTLEFKAGTYRIGSNISLDELVYFHKGASLSIDGGVTVTITGQLVAGQYAIFAGAGAVSLGAGSCEYVLPQWWGAVGDDSTACHPAFESAIAAADTVGKVYIPAGIYQIADSLDNFPTSLHGVGDGMVFQGAGMGKTILKYTKDGGWLFDWISGAGAREVIYTTVKDLEIQCTGLVTTEGGAFRIYGNYNAIERVHISQTDETYGVAVVCMDNSIWNWILDSRIRGTSGTKSAVCIRMQGDSQLAINDSFIDGMLCLETRDHSVTSSGIAFVDSNPDTITDSGSGLGGFIEGDSLIVTGTTNNNGVYTVDSAVAGTITLDAGDTLTAEGAGASVALNAMWNGILNIDSSVISADTNAGSIVGYSETSITNTYIEGGDLTYDGGKKHSIYGCHVSSNIVPTFGTPLLTDRTWKQVWTGDNLNGASLDYWRKTYLSDTIWDLDTGQNPTFVLTAGVDFAAAADSLSGNVINLNSNGEGFRIEFDEGSDANLKSGTYLITVYAKASNVVSGDLLIAFMHAPVAGGQKERDRIEHDTIASGKFEPYKFLFNVKVDDDITGGGSKLNVAKDDAAANSIDISHITLEYLGHEKLAQKDIVAYNAEELDADGSRESNVAFIGRRLDSEVLDETDFATHASWDRTGDFDDTGGNAAYTNAAGSGTLTQPNGSMAGTYTRKRWYKFDYTVSGVSGDPAAEIATTTAETAQSLTLANGSYTLYFRASDPSGVDFVISATSTSGGFTLDDFSLRRTGFQHVLANFKASHDGTGVDEKGKWEIKANDGNDGFTPSLGISGDSSGNLAIDGDLSLTDDDITNVGDIAVDSISADSGAGLGNRISAPNPIMVYIPGGYYREADDVWQYKGVGAAADRYTIQSPSRLLLDVDGVMYLISAQADYVLSAAGSWDTTAGTDYTVAANRAGVDFYIYAIQPASGTTPLIEVSDNSSAPDGYTTANSRKIGGFHGLCAAVGTIGGHPLTDHVAGDILPDSVWDYDHRPVSEPEGMVFSEKADIWVDIYLISGTGGSTASAYAGTISDSRDWMDFVDDTAAVKKRLLWDYEFSAIAAGSNEETNIAGSADPVTTGGHSDTAGRRMISNIGVEDACGVTWQWLLDTSYRYDAGDHTHTATVTYKASATGSAVYKDQAESNFNAVTGSGADETVNTSSSDPEPVWGYYNLPGSKGSFYRQGTYGTTQLLAGASWNDGANAGSRSRNANSYRWSAGSSIGGRGASERRK